MANLPLAFSELLAGGIFIVAASTGDSIADVMRGAITPKPLPGAAGRDASPAGGGSATGVPDATPDLAGGLKAHGYVNPFPGAQPSRVDQGVDYTGRQFLAPGNSRIVVVQPHSAGWRGGGYVAGELVDGPLKGKVWFMAEGLHPIVKAGDAIAAGTRVAQAMPNPYNSIVGNIEAGWADPKNPYVPLAQSTGGYSEGQSTAAGASWNRFVKGLGGAVGALRTAIRGDVSGLGLP